MANKFRPGIPDSFSLDVSPVQDLGDYLDEPAPSPRPPKRAVTPDAPVVAPARPGEVLHVTPVPRVQQPAALAEAEVRPPVVAAPVRPNTSASPEIPAPIAPRNDDEPEARGLRPKAPRREISMTPETLRMSDELLDIIRGGSGQRDTKANELFHALVLLVHEVRDELDVHALPKRGRWGTPTARAYPHEIKNAFVRALLRRYGERGGDTILLRHPIDSAA